jgi:hypothetical protein
LFGADSKLLWGSPLTSAIIKKAPRLDDLKESELTPMAFYTHPGNIHIHSSYSDGSGDFDHIARAASAAGLDYIIICDHQTLAGLSEEAFYDDVLVLVGAELNSQSNHYLALDINRLIDSNDQNPQQVIDQVRKANGLGFIAHPFERGSRYIEKGKAYPWTYWPVFGFNGIELWNFLSYWRGLHPSLFRTLYWFFLNRKGAMKGPPSSLLRLWDCYNINGHKTVGIGSSDAHAFIYKTGFFRIVLFSYRYIFGTINTYIVLREELDSEFAVAREQVLSALREGRCYISYDSLYPGKDFFFYAADDEKQVTMGEETDFREGISLHIKTPGRKPLVRLICDGKLIHEEETDQLEYKPSKPGIYRVEICHRTFFGPYRPWIYSNPIYIRPVASSLQ